MFSAMWLGNNFAKLEFLVYFAAALSQVYFAAALSHEVISLYRHSYARPKCKFLKTDIIANLRKNSFCCNEFLFPFNSKFFPN